MTTQWYLRSTRDHDTHRGTLAQDCWVEAVCGARFVPLPTWQDRGPALPGYPPDPDQVCTQCKNSPTPEAT